MVTVVVAAFQFWEFWSENVFWENSQNLSPKFWYSTLIPYENHSRPTHARPSHVCKSKSWLPLVFTGVRASDPKSKTKCGISECGQSRSDESVLVAAGNAGYQYQCHKKKQTIKD